VSASMPPWTDDLDDLLEAERDLAPVGDGAVARMAARLGAALPPGAMVPGGAMPGGDGSSGGAPEGGGAVGDGASAGGAAGLAHSAPPAGSALLASSSATGAVWAANAKLGVAIVAFAVGAAFGAGGHAALVGGPAPSSVASTVPPEVATSAPPAPQPAVVPAAAATSSESVDAPSAPRSSALPPSPRPATSVEVAASAAPPEAGRVDEALRSERALLERAGVALAKGDANGALEALEAHRARFPKGNLAEERDALVVKALSARGDAAAAQAAAAKFRADHPDSLQGDPLK